MFLLAVNLFAKDSDTLAPVADSVSNQAPNLFSSFFPMVLIFIVFYFILIRPQQKKQKAFQDKILSLTVGSKIITYGGIIGKIIKIQESEKNEKVFHIESLSSVFEITSSSISKIL